MGNKIDLKIAKLSSFNGILEADDTTVLANDNGTYDVVTNLAQTLSTGAGTAPSDALESQLVALNDATVESGSAPAFQVRYGTGPAASRLFATEDPGLCVGATFDFIGVVTEWTSGPQLESTRSEDFSNLDTTGCSN